MFPDLQEFYQGIPVANDQRDTFIERLAHKMVVVGTEMPWGSTLAEAIQEIPNADALLRRFPLNDDELAYCEGQVRFIHELLGEEACEVNEDKIRDNPIPYLQLMHDALLLLSEENPGDLEENPGEDAPERVFNLIPQAHNYKSFVRVRTPCCSLDRPAIWIYTFMSHT